MNSHGKIKKILDNLLVKAVRFHEMSTGKKLIDPNLLHRDDYGEEGFKLFEEHCLLEGFGPEFLDKPQVELDEIAEKRYKEKMASRKAELEYSAASLKIKLEKIERELEDLE